MARSADLPGRGPEAAWGWASPSGSLALSIPAHLGDRAAGATPGIASEHVAPDFRPAPCAVVKDPLAIWTPLEAKPGFIGYRVDDDGEHPAHGARARC